MPRYDYELCEGKCEYCGGRFEVTQPMSEPALTECPMCDRPVRRCVSVAGIKVKPFNAELRDLGLTKLVKRSDGSYENVTRRRGEPAKFDPQKFKLPGDTDCGPGGCGTR